MVDKDCPNLKVETLYCLITTKCGEKTKIVYRDVEPTDENVIFRKNLDYILFNIMMTHKRLTTAAGA
jgi:alkylation response protein AidB-like acyl-CoA dehydrogenase